MNIARDCELCNEPESIDHLFASCAYTKWMLSEFMEVAGRLVKLQATTTPNTSNVVRGTEDIGFMCGFHT